MSTIQEFDFSVDLLRALLWRNNEAPNIQALLQFKQDFSDEDSRDFWTDWAVDVFDLRTADEFGLNVWSIILGLSITIEPTINPVDNGNWGFGANRLNFGTALNPSNFSPSENEFSLTVEDARIVLRLRYYQLTTNGNVTGINLLLQDVFGALGSVFVTDNLDMTIDYTFRFQLSTSLQNALTSLDLLPRPAGVEANFSVTFANNSWGFGPDRKNFENGNFNPAA